MTKAITIRENKIQTNAPYLYLWRAIGTKLQEIFVLIPHLKGTIVEFPSEVEIKNDSVQVKIKVKDKEPVLEKEILYAEAKYTVELNEEIDVVEIFVAKNKSILTNSMWVKYSDLGIDAPGAKSVARNCPYVYLEKKKDILSGKPIWTCFPYLITPLYGLCVFEERVAVTYPEIGCCEVLTILTTNTKNGSLEYYADLATNTRYYHSLKNGVGRFSVGLIIAENPKEAIDLSKLKTEQLHRLYAEEHEEFHKRDKKKLKAVVRNFHAYQIPSNAISNDIEEEE